MRSSIFAIALSAGLLVTSLASADPAPAPPPPPVDGRAAPRRRGPAAPRRQGRKRSGRPRMPSTSRDWAPGSFIRSTTIARSATSPVVSGSGTCRSRRPTSDSSGMSQRHVVGRVLRDPDLRQLPGDRLEEQHAGARPRGDHLAHGRRRQHHRREARAPRRSDSATLVFPSGSSGIDTSRPPGASSSERGCRRSLPEARFPSFRGRTSRSAARSDARFARHELDTRSRRALRRQDAARRGRRVGPAVRADVLAEPWVVRRQGAQVFAHALALPPRAVGHATR